MGCRSPPPSATTGPTRPGAEPCPGALGARAVDATFTRMTRSKGGDHARDTHPSGGSPARAGPAGRTGTSFVVTGSGFSANAQYLLQDLDATGKRLRDDVPITTDANGGFKVTITAGNTAGQRTVRMSDNALVTGQVWAKKVTLLDSSRIIEPPVVSPEQPPIP